MRTFIPLLIVVSLVLAACGTTQATQAPEFPTLAPASPIETPVSPTEAPAPTDPATSAPASTTEPAQPAQSSSTDAGVEIYTISALDSAVTYQVGEVFINQNNRINTAVGVTKGISGKVMIDRANPQNSTIEPITIDISQFTSDSSRRDNAIRQRFLESSKYPQATFVTTQIEGLPSTIQDGETYPLKISGDLTIREVTKAVTFDANVRLDQDRLSGQAGTTLLMSDFGFGPISIAGILKTEDQINLGFEFVALRTLNE
jgi:polyisoprenoid-binding protein YceI